jgi:hypothetical protein
MGVFVNFRDFKGNIMDALNKLINDLKKFGSQAVRMCKPENLSKGFGEEVCQLIDELLNIELYRREYQFHNPVFPEETGHDQSDDNEDAVDQNAEFHGTQELNGIMIKTTDDQSNLIGGSGSAAASNAQ